MDVPELWRYEGRKWRVYQLQGNIDREGDRRPTFPEIEKADIYQFLDETQQDEIRAEQAFRARVRARLNQSVG